MKNKGIDVFEVRQNNDAYNAFKEGDGLIMMDATGTNDNDVAVLLVKR